MSWTTEQLRAAYAKVTGESEREDMDVIVAEVRACAMMPTLEGAVRWLEECGWGTPELASDIREALGVESPRKTVTLRAAWVVGEGRYNLVGWTECDDPMESALDGLDDDVLARGFVEFEVEVPELPTVRDVRVEDGR